MTTPNKTDTTNAPFEWAKKVLGLLSYEFDRTVGEGQRFTSSVLNGLKIDVWATGKWGIVGRNVYGTGSLDLLMYLRAEEKNLQVIVRTGRDCRRFKFLSIGLVETDSVSEIVSIHYKDNSQAWQDSQIQKHRHKADKGYFSALDLT